MKNHSDTSMVIQHRQRHAEKSLKMSILQLLPHSYV